MEHGTTLLASIHIFIAVILSIVVLLQDSKSSGVGGSFGGAGSQSLFGATGAEDFLAKTTKVLGGLFAVTCIALTLLLTHHVNHSVVDSLPLSAPANSATTQSGAPAAPVAAPQTAPPASK